MESFHILRVIGRGSFGKVYLVQKKDSQEYFAMKSLKKDMVLRRHQKENTLSERLILEKIKHPYIVGLHYAFQTPDNLYFVIDFLNGGELYYHLRRERRFSERRGAFYAAEILLALDCLHNNGVIYRDLKPENVILDSDGHIKLTDFGLSKIRSHEKEMSHTFCGTPEYMAPEVVKGTGYGRSVDFWSLGLLLYEMLSGINPFKVKNKNKYQKLLMITEEKIQMLPCFSKVATSLLQKLLLHDPKKRLGGGKAGINEIKSHDFFKDIDWEALEKRQVRAPFVPKIQDELDLSNIDRVFTREQPRETPEQNTSMLRKEKFDQFTYVDDGNQPIVQSNSIMVDVDENRCNSLCMVEEDTQERKQERTPGLTTEEDSFSLVNTPQ